MPPKAVSSKTKSKKTYAKYAVEAIVALQEYSGSSVQAIFNYISEKNPKLEFSRFWLRTALKKGVETDMFKQVKASFKLGSEAKKTLKMKIKKVKSKKATSKKPATSEKSSKKVTKKVGAKPGKKIVKKIVKKLSKKDSTKKSTQKKSPQTSKATTKKSLTKGPSSKKSPASRSTAGSKSSSTSSSNGRSGAASGVVHPKAAARLGAGISLVSVGISPELYDIVLSKINFAANEDKFYVLQVLRNSTSTQFHTYFHWGRTGTDGQEQVLGPFPQSGPAIQAFENKFQEKTGNIWANRSPTNFTAQENQYDIVRVNQSRVQSDASRTGKVAWEYYVDDHVDGKATGWYPFSADGAAGVEALWGPFQDNPRMSQRVVASGNLGYYYRIELDQMQQTNTSTNKVRRIRRTIK